MVLFKKNTDDRIHLTPLQSIFSDTANYINPCFLLFFMVDIRITYETLFDLLRREKNREELQDLEEDFYEQVLAYLKEKRSVLSKKKDELFVSAEKEKLKIQFQNIRRIVKELFERREKKIINMAVSKVRTGSDIIDTGSLLPSEKEFFEDQVSLLSKYKDGVLNNILHLKEFNNPNRHAMDDDKDKDSKDNKNGKNKNNNENNENKVSENNEQNNEKSAQVSAQRVAEVTNETKKVRLKEDVPEFVGCNGEVLGPFKKGDEAELEPEIADLLVEKGSAETCQKQ